MWADLVRFTCASVLLETHCYARPSDRRNCTLSEFPAPISCGPTERGLIRSNEILTHTSAGNVAGFLGVIWFVIVMDSDLCLLESACDGCFSIVVGPGSDMSLMETA